MNKFIIVITTMTILCSTGCSISHTGKDTLTAFSGQTAPTAKRLIMLADDRSRSTGEIRNQLLTTAFDAGTGIQSSTDDFRMFRFGHSVEECYSGRPVDDDAFALNIANNLKSDDPILGTNYPLVLETLAEEADAAPEPQILIVIVGDCQNDYIDDPAMENRYRAAALRLSQNRRVKFVRFWGATTGTREELRSVCKPLGNRLQIMTLDQNPLVP